MDISIWRKSLRDKPSALCVKSNVKILRILGFIYADGRLRGKGRGRRRDFGKKDKLAIRKDFIHLMKRKRVLWNTSGWKLMFILLHYNCTSRF